MAACFISTRRTIMATMICKFAAKAANPFDVVSAAMAQAPRGVVAACTWRTGHSVSVR